MTYQVLSVSSLYILFLIGPGYAVLSILGVTKNRFLLAYGISFTILVLTLAAFQALGGTLRSWLFVLFGLEFLILISGILLKIRFSTHQKRLTHGIRSQSGDSVRKDSGLALAGFFFSTAIIALYHLIFGPFTEIPSDYWEHLARAESLSSSIQSGLGGEFPLASLRSIFQSDGIYLLHALVAIANDSSPLDASPGATLSMSIIFLGSIYWFSLSLVDKTSLSNLWKIVVGLLTVLFTVLSFGTATFSYIRYYAYFPTIFCFPIVFLCIRLLLDYQEQPIGSMMKILIIPVFLLAISIAHLQEVLFASVIMIGLIFWRAAQSLLVPNEEPPESVKRHRVLAALAGLAIPVSIWLILHFGEMSPWGYTPHTVGLPAWIPIIGKMPVANPGFRFWDTLGFFGLIAYLIYLTNWSLFKKSGYLLVAMTSPLFTHFNPFYAYIFLHIGASTALWRTSYLMPLSFVVSFFLVNQFASITKTRNIRVLISTTAIIVVLLITLLPFEINGHKNRLSRLPSLLPVEATAGRLLWHDLIVEVRNIKANQHIRGVITDHITKFVLDSAVFGKVPTRQGREYFPGHNADYKIDLLYSDFSYHLLILNRRDGQQTESARLSGHWDHKILSTSEFYPADISNFIQNNPDLFRLLWKQNSITIYQVVSN